MFNVDIKLLINKLKLWLNLRFLSSLAISWAFFFLWVFLTPSEPNNFGNSQINNTLRLSANRKIIRRFMQEFDMSPLRLREFQVFGIDRYSYLHDQFGQRFNYIPLSENDWLMRSFGRDGIQNTLLTVYDDYVASWTGKKTQGVSYDYPNPPHIYPPALLEGYYSPDGKMIAKLFKHEYLSHSILVVHEVTGKPFVNVAFHDQVEEFYWLPDSKQIVFTASGSFRYKDGAYLWNLKTNTAAQILGKESILPWESSAGESYQWYLSLGGVDTKNNHLYIFIQPRSEYSMAFFEFFSPDSLFVYDLTKTSPLKNDEYKEKALLHFKKDPLNGLMQIKHCDKGTTLQQNWCHLDYRGFFEEVLLNWQSYTEDSARSQMFTYSLWALSIFYLDVLSLWDQKPESSDDSDPTRNILATYGAEIAQTLRLQNMSPLWVQAMAEYFWELLIVGKSLPQVVSPISLKSEIKPALKTQSE